MQKNNAQYFGAIHGVAKVQQHRSRDLKTGDISNDTEFSHRFQTTFTLDPTTRTNIPSVGSAHPMTTLLNTTFQEKPACAVL